MNILMPVNSCPRIPQYHAVYLRDLALGRYFFLLYINNIPLISNFETTLFADDTWLMMADKNMKNLEHKVQIELKNVNSWLCQNKLSLNFSKINYIILNKQPLKTCQCNFRMALTILLLIERILSNTLGYLLMIISNGCRK